MLGQLQRRWSSSECGRLPELSLVVIHVIWHRIIRITVNGQKSWITLSSYSEWLEEGWMDSDFMILDNVVGELLGSCRHFVTSSLIRLVILYNYSCTLIDLAFQCCAYIHLYWLLWWQGWVETVLSPESKFFLLIWRKKMRRMLRDMFKGIYPIREEAIVT